MPWRAAPAAGVAGGAGRGCRVRLRRREIWPSLGAASQGGCAQGSRIMGTSKFRTKSVRNYTSVPVIVEYTENMLEIKLEKYIRTW